MSIIRPPESCSSNTDRPGGWLSCWETVEVGRVSNAMSNAAVRRDQIVDAAATLFDVAGYHQTSMEDIADAIGVRKPTIYHYYESKQEILYHIHDEFIGLLIERHEVRSRSRMPPSQALLEVMADIVELMQTHRGHVRVFFEHHRELPPEHHRAIQLRRDEYFAAVEGLVLQAVADDEYETEDARLTTLAIFGMCNWAYTWFRPDGGRSPREIAYHLWDLVTYGAKPREDSPT